MSRTWDFVRNILQYTKYKVYPSGIEGKQTDLAEAPIKAKALLCTNSHTYDLNYH